MKQHWLVRPRTIRLLWMAFIAVLAATVAAEFFFREPAHEGIGGSFGFNAWFGFGACAVLILAAKGIALFLKRPDNYYDASDD